MAGLATAVARIIWDGLTLANRAEYEDWVRRAAASEPIASPPIRPRSSAIVRYAPHSRRKVALNRYHHVRRTLLTCPTHHGEPAPPTDLPRSLPARKGQRTPSFHRADVSDKEASFISLGRASTTRAPGPSPGDTDRAGAAVIARSDRGPVRTSTDIAGETRRERSGAAGRSAQTHRSGDSRSGYGMGTP